MKNNFMVVILGSDENVYGIARSFYEAYKIKPIALCKRKLIPTRYSKILKIICKENFTNEDVFEQTLIDLAKKLKENYEKLILIPCSDYYASLIIKHKNILKYYENNFISEELLNSFITKDKFYNLCEKYNILYPKTLVIKYKDRKSVLDNLNISFPIVLKPNNSNSTEYLNAKFKGKKKVFIINNKKELENVIENINKSNYNDNLIIQEFVPGDDTNMRVINSYSDKNGKVKMIVMGKVLLEEYTPNELGNYSAIISDTNEKDLLINIKNFLEKIKYTGFANFDFKYDEKEKKYKCFEINPRQGRSSYFVETCGISLSKLIVSDLVNNEQTKAIIGAKKEILWLNVPFWVLKKYIFNKNLKTKIIEFKKSNKIVYTLFYKKDLNIKRYLTLKKENYNKYKFYKKYFIKKDSINGLNK